MEAPRPKHMTMGKKISRIREWKGLEQEFVAAEWGMSQQAVSKMEQSEVIEEEVLERVAKALDVSAEAIKNFSEEAVIYNIQNNYEGSNEGVASVSVGNYHCTFNPIDKIVELYDALLKSEREKVELLKEHLKNQK